MVESEWRLIVDSIPGLVATLTPSGEVEFVNRQVISYCGRSLEELKQWGRTDTVHPEDLPRAIEVIGASMSSGEPYEIVERVRRFDGIYRWFQVRGLPLRDAEGRIARWYMLLVDIDELKRAEDALRALDHLRSELARVARVTTLTALTASIAHEVNQPLTGILTNAGTCLRMLEANPPNVQGARDVAKRLVRDAERGAQVMKRLRELFNRKAFTPEPMDLNDAVREVLALALGELQRHRVALETRLAPDLPPIVGDRVQLQQVMLNLLRNACDAMLETEDRQRAMLVSTARGEDGAVRFSVRDTGIGLAAESIERLFQPFYTTKSGGMGIGLAVSQLIIERHQCRLWGESNPEGPGATFFFSLPAPD